MKKLIAASFLVFGLATAGFSATISPFLSHMASAQALPPVPGPQGQELWSHAVSAQVLPPVPGPQGQELWSHAVFAQALPPVPGPQGQE